MRAQPSTGTILRALCGRDPEIVEAADLLELLKRIRADQDVKQLLRNIVQSPAVIQVMAGHSYSHNNGCDKFVLDSLAEFGIKLRLHVWWPTVRPESESNIHDHPWSFASSIIIGRLTTRGFISTDAKRGFVAAHYPTLAVPSTARMVKLAGTAGLDCVSEVAYGAGAFYVLSRSELHSVVVTQRVTATLVLQGRHESEWTRVYAEDSNKLLSPFAIRYFDENEIAERLSRLSALLS